MSSAAVRRPAPPPERPDLEAFRAKAIQAVREMREAAVKNGLDKLTDEEIQAEIDAYRAERELRGG